MRQNRSAQGAVNVHAAAVYAALIARETQTGAAKRGPPHGDGPARRRLETLLEPVTEPGQFEEHEFNQLVVLKLIHYCRHQFQQGLGPEPENALIAVRLGEVLL